MLLYNYFYTNLSISLNNKYFDSNTISISNKEYKVVYIEKKLLCRKCINEKLNSNF